VGVVCRRYIVVSAPCSASLTAGSAAAYAICGGRFSGSGEPRQHATFFCDPPAGHPLHLNEQAPANYLDVTRYTTPSGLTMIMR